jgi:hypothetical protein
MNIKNTKTFTLIPNPLKLLEKLHLEKVICQTMFGGGTIYGQMCYLLSTEKTVYWCSQLYKKEQVSGLVIYADLGLYLNSATVLIPTYVICPELGD